MGLDNPIHIAFLLILLLLVFGAKRLPEMGRSLGDGMRGFKDAISGESPPTAQPAALVTQPQPQTAVAPVQQVPVQQVPAPVHAVPTAQPVMEKLPA
jgi:sec-independent protein translocase protein TatA